MSEAGPLPAQWPPARAYVIKQKGSPTRVARYWRNGNFVLSSHHATKYDDPVRAALTIKYNKIRDAQVEAVLK